MALEEDERFLRVWLLYYESNFCRNGNGGAKISTVKSFFMEIVFFFLSAFISSEMLSKNAFIQSKLPTAAWRSPRKKRKV